MISMRCTTSSAKSWPNRKHYAMKVRIYPVYYMLFSLFLEFVSRHETADERPKDRLVLQMVNRSKVMMLKLLEAIQWSMFMTSVLL